ncbi:MAG: SURF1 family protein [Hyphomonadaceae bacterium]|nr:SURF1 family protein [Hyphomonadaceae bacterium]
MRVRLNPLPVMTILSIAAFLILILLGHWQWRRYEDRRLLAEAPPATAVLEPFEAVPEGLQLVFGARDGAPGWRVFEPVRYGERTVFVDCDYVPGAAPPDWRTLEPCRALAGARAVSGVIVRPKGASAFTARSDPAARLWYAADLPGMAAAAGLPDPETYYVAIPYVGPTGEATPNPFAAGALGAEPLPPARHLGYALTWWGLAGALVGVYLAFHARQGRLTIRRTPKT